jgi:hypothetical protein
LESAILKAAFILARSIGKARYSILMALVTAHSARQLIDAKSQAAKLNIVRPKEIVNSLGIREWSTFYTRLRNVDRKKPIEFPQQGTFELLDAAQAFASEDIVERPDAVLGRGKYSQGAGRGL